MLARPLNKFINQTHITFSKSSYWLSAINYLHSFWIWYYAYCDRVFRLLTDKRKCYFATRKKSLLPMWSNFWTKTKGAFLREVILFYWKKKLKQNGRGRKWKLSNKTIKVELSLIKAFKKNFFSSAWKEFFFSLASTETEVLFPLGFWDQVIKSLLNWWETITLSHHPHQSGCHRLCGSVGIL